MYSWEREGILYEHHSSKARLAVAGGAADGAGLGRGIHAMDFCRTGCMRLW